MGMNVYDFVCSTTASELKLSLRAFLARYSLRFRSALHRRASSLWVHIYPLDDSSSEDGRSNSVHVPWETRPIDSLVI